MMFGMERDIKYELKKENNYASSDVVNIQQITLQSKIGRFKLPYHKVQLGRTLSQPELLLFNI